MKKKNEQQKKMKELQKTDSAFSAATRSTQKDGQKGKRKSQPKADLPLAEKKKKKDIAISVKSLSKNFLVPHQKIDSVRGAFVNLFHKNSYEKFEALKDVSFEVHKGDFIGIIGHNGSGKSTLLKCLAGVYQADEGEITVNGRISPFLELGIGFNPELSGRDNIYLNATILGLSRKEIDEKFDDIVAFSEIEKFIDQRVKNYSSGMRGRLAFSVSIHANRDILLMDEVLAVGDSRFQKKCFRVFENYKKENRTVILVTHDMGAVREYCDSAILLHHGKALMTGDVDKVCDEYILKNLTKEQRLERAKQERQQKKEEQREKDIAQQQGISQKAQQRKQKEAEEKAKKTQREAEEKEKKRLAEIEKNKKAKITKVEFLDSNGKSKNIFQTGDDISIRVYFKTNQLSTQLNFGLVIRNNENFYVSGINTIFDDIDTHKNIQKGYFQVNYKNIPLVTNTYHVLVNLTKDDWDNSYDLLEKSNIFKVVSNNKNEGVVDFHYTWE